MTVGELIKKLRDQKGFSQRQLALYSGVSNTEISKIESGERKNPNPEILKKIASALNIDYTVFFKAAGYLEPDIPSNSNKDAATKIAAALQDSPDLLDSGLLERNQPAGRPPAALQTGP
ncbi:MAG: helix-turn-helix transcriptional regulator [Firmicutes bacterium]|jgi:transcriptional regulator with XRE-family HTH domain|nr:helix-turn-helix transcriptional regulator [Bacillota bacterium]